MRTVQQFAVMVTDDLLSDFMKVSHDGERTYLVTGMAQSIDGLVDMFATAIAQMDNDPTK